MENTKRLFNWHESLASDKLTEAHVAWCREHEWGKNAYFHNGRIHNIWDYKMICGKRYVYPKSFSTFQKLKIWAGYCS